MGEIVPMRQGRPFVLGLAGPAGVGKSTVAAALRRIAPDSVTMGTGAPLKAMMAGFYSWCGLSPAEIAERIGGDMKRRPDPALCGATPTHAMQTLGTEWGRDLIASDLWLQAWTRRAAAHLKTGTAVINDSVRFENEARAILGMGGLVIRLGGRAGDDVGAHVSETVLPPELISATVPNAEGRPDLAAAAIFAMT